MGPFTTHNTHRKNKMKKLKSLAKRFVASREREAVSRTSYWYQKDLSNYKRETETKKVANVVTVGWL